MNIPVPTEELDYDEDAEELFTGPSFADDSLEEYDALEISEELSGAQSGVATLQFLTTTNPGLVSQYTQFVILHVICVMRRCRCTSYLATARVAKPRSSD